MLDLAATAYTGRAIGPGNGVTGVVCPQDLAERFSKQQDQEVLCHDILH